VGSGDVVVRPASVADAEAITAVYRPYVDESVISFEEIAPDAGEMTRRMTASPRLPWLVAERTGAVVGYAYASLHHERAAYRWSADCSVYLAAGERGRGTGSMLYAELLPLLRRLGYTRVFAGIALPNEASVGLHESMGFTLVGVYHRVGFKHGAWHDVGWWELPLADVDGAPEEPREWVL
jgi:L-amino acid N-acyltransferase YncA